MSSLDIIGGHSTPLLCDRHTDFPKWNEIFPVTLKSVKVERFARKEAELAERGECVPVIYPDPSVPYEERCGLNF